MVTQAIRDLGGCEERKGRASQQPDVGSRTVGKKRKRMQHSAGSFFGASSAAALHCAPACPFARQGSHSSPSPPVRARIGASIVSMSLSEDPAQELAAARTLSQTP